MSNKDIALPLRKIGVTENPWQSLRAYTTARIALGRADVSLPTSALLAFQLDHARARDAVHAALNLAVMGSELRKRGFDAFGVRSQAGARDVYIRRPDLGRLLDVDSLAALGEWRASNAGEFDAVIVLADGLSARAVECHALPLLEELVCELKPPQWQLGPVILVEQGRVAIGDQIGTILGARQALVLIGERPGLSAPDSLGAYLTYDPQPGRIDAERNCVSNIRTAGLSYEEAARRIVFLMTEARRRKLSGVALKDESDAPTEAAPDNVLYSRNFLIE